MKINAAASKAFAEALTAGDAPAIADAWEASMEAIADSIRADYRDFASATDKAVLAQRGYRQLTAAEDKYYETLARAVGAKNGIDAMQVFSDMIGDDADDALMPITILEDVFDNLVAERPLLQAINFQFTGYATKWIRNKHKVAKAAWGNITDAISKEITSDFDVIDIEQNKLTAFAVVPLDILDMGHTFMDRYVRACLSEAIYSGLESAIIGGIGIKGEPVGLDRDIHEGVSVSTSTGYPQKNAETVTSFGIADYCELVAKLAKTEDGKFRKFSRVGLIVNAVDNISKVIPATKLLTQLGYVGDQFPYPTEVYPSVEMPEGKAIMFLPECYTFCVGGSRNGVIEFDDSFKFLDDARTFKVIQHGDGIADDNTAAILLDISGLETLVPAVTVAGTVTTAATV